MPVFIKEKKSVLYIHIPKCAGSSFEKLMVADGWKEYFSIRGINLKDMEWCKITPQHHHASLLSESFKCNFFDLSIAVVRNPFRRLVSEYFWQKSQGITSLAPSEWLNLVFSEFVNDASIYDNHIRPQSDFIMENTKFFKLEESGVDLAMKLVRQISPTSKFSIRYLKSCITRSKKQKKSIYNQELVEEFNLRKNEIEFFYKSDYEMFKY